MPTGATACCKKGPQCAEVDVHQLRGIGRHYDLLALFAKLSKMEATTRTSAALNAVTPGSNTRTICG